MRMSDRLYQILKWVCIVCLPALITFLGIVLPTVGVSSELTTTITTIIAATATFIGTLIGISNAQYTAEQKKDEADF